MTQRQERRRFVRLDTTLPVTYRVLPSSTAQVATTKDIGGGGICVFLTQRLSVGTPLEIEVRLPNRPTPVCLTGEVVWCEEYEVVGKTERNRAIQAGVRFVYFDPKDQEAIMQHVILSLPSVPPRSP